MHGHDFDMTFYIGLPPRRFDLGRHNDGAVVLGPSLKILVDARIDPVSVFCNCHLTVVRDDGLSDAAKVGKGIVVDPDPVADIAAGHTLNVEIIAVGHGSNKDRDRDSLLWISSIMDAQRLSGEVQLQIDTGIALNVEGDLIALEPLRIPPAKLAVTEGPAAVYNAGSIILFP